MVSEKRRILDWFFRALIPRGEQEFDELLRTAAIEALNKDPTMVDAYVQANSHRFWNEIRKASTEVAELGLLPLCRGYTVPPTKRCTWIPTGPFGSAEEERRSIGLSHRPSLLRRIDALTHREYEAIAAYIAELGGADTAVVTPPGNEGGVDMFARLTQPLSCHIFSGPATPVRLVGQSKKYETKVPVEKVREFITTLNDIRHDTTRMSRIIPAWFKASRGPIIGWMISHSGFQSGAVTVANSHGILLSTSLDIAEVCCQSARLMHCADANARIAEMQTRVAHYLSRVTA